MPQTNWTVIPRGKRGNMFHFAVFVTPNQQIDINSFDSNFWAGWLSKAVPTIVSKGGVLNVSNPGQPTTSIPFAFPPPPVDAPENIKAWAALLAYVPPVAPLQGDAAAIASTSAALDSAAGPGNTDAHDLIAMTSPLHDIVQHVGQLNVAHTYAAMSAREPKSGLQLFSATIAAITSTIADLSFLKPRTAKPSQNPTQTAIDFQNSIKKLMAQGGRLAVRQARLAERNLYRLSDNPYNTLNDKVFIALMKLLNPSRQPGRPSKDEDALTSFVELAVFHKRCQPKKLAPPASQSVRPAAATPSTIPDLFRSLNTLASFPEWLTRLGFAYEIQIAIPSGLTDQTTLSVTSPLDGTSSVQVACTGDGYPKYIPPPTTESVTFNFSNGYLVLNDCDLAANDLDGEGLRTIQYANSLRSRIPPTPTPNNEGDLPDPPITDNAVGPAALPSRSMGISLIHPDTAAHLKERLRRYVDDLKQPATTPTLGLIDLIRGYSPELSVDGTNWKSLTQRRVAYNVTQTPPDSSTIPEDQFILQEDVPLDLGAATHSDKPSPGTSTSGVVLNHHTASTLFRWEGWGLTVPSPYPKVGDQGVKQVPSATDIHFPIAACYQPLNNSKNGFTRLRFGNTYQIRVCPVDLLGQRMAGVDSGTTSSPKTVLSIQYSRYDPVHPPEVLLEGTLDPTEFPGESLNCIVVRDNDMNHQSLRCLVPPVAGFDLIVQHGYLDSDAIISENGFKSYDEIGSFDDVLIDPNGKFPTIKLPSKTDGKETKYEVPIYQAGKSQPSCAYLPDPMAQAVLPAFVDLSDSTNTLISSIGSSPFGAASFYPDDGNGPRQWPDARRMRLVVQTFPIGLPDSPQATWEWNTSEKLWILNVTIPKAWQVKLLLRCVPDEDNAAKLFAAPADADKFGPTLFQTLSTDQNFSVTAPPLKQEVAKALASGVLPNVTPAHEIVIISAVRRPLAASQIEKGSITIQQTYDSPIVALSFKVDIGDRRSTGKLEIIAGWSDPKNDPSQSSGFLSVASTSHIAQYSLNTQNSNTIQPFTGIKQTFPDTRWRSVELSVDSVSRFMHYYTDDKSETDFVTSEPAPHQTITVLSTSRPQPLRVVKMIPLLSTQSRDTEYNTHFHKRLGGAFRIYIDCPWDSTGIGELLGISLWGEMAPKPANPCYDSADKFVPVAYKSWYGNTVLEPYVTRWGADPAMSSATERPDDPVWESPLMRLAPSSAAFKIPPAKPGDPLQSALIHQCAFPAEIPLDPSVDTQPTKLDPTSTPYLTLATYPVQWDAGQQLWYSDILIEHAPPGFIRLALLRYQPQSLINRECSPIVIAPFALLGHERSVYLQKKQDGSLELQILGAPRFVNSTRKFSRFEVELQVRSGDIWKPVPQKPQPEPISVNPISPDNLYPLLVAFSMQVDKPYHDRRVIIREFQAWFADTPGQRSIRTEQDRLVGPPIMLVLPDFN